MFLVQEMILLHKPKYFGMYHEQLSFCVTLFSKIESLLLLAWPMSGLLKY